MNKVNKKLDIDNRVCQCSCVIAGILCGVVNSYLRTSFDITVTVLSFGLWEILLIFGITFLVAILSSLLPIYRIAKKQPVEAMKS